MDKIKILIVDADSEFTEKVRSILECHADIEIAGICGDGAVALETAHRLHPDVILFDLVLPGLDGIAFLKDICSIKHPPMAVCCTQFYSSVILEIARKCGASYFLYKPIDFRSLYETIKGCFSIYMQMQHALQSENGSRSGSALEIRNYLVSLGIPAKLIGCSYLSEAVRLALKDISLTQNLSKGLYLEIARNMDTTPTCIERCIRSAISAAYQSGRLGERMITCPSNKEFINYVLRTFDA